MSKEELKTTPFGQFNNESVIKPNPFPSIDVKEDEDDQDELEFDVDELVKKIDAKIAELEREEALERQKSKSKGASSTKETTPVVETPQQKPTNLNLEELDEDDDDFFDDFFDN